MIGFDGFAQGCFGTDDFFLTEEMVKTNRSHPVSQWLQRTVHVSLAVPDFITEKVHGENILSPYGVDNHNVNSSPTVLSSSKAGPIAYRDFSGRSP